MCGQAGIHRIGDKPVGRLGYLANALLVALENRGTDATGLLAMADNGHCFVQKRTVRAREFVHHRKNVPASTRTMLLHTRYATVGGNTPVNAHPQGAGTIGATHNGTIYNADEVFAAFKLERNAQVDSEVIPAIVNYAGWENAGAALELLDGGAAVALINTKAPNEFILARLDGMPLHYLKTKNAIVWASTANALRLAWHAAYGRRLRAKIYELAEGDLIRFVDGKPMVETMPRFAALAAERAKRAAEREANRKVWTWKWDNHKTAGGYVSKAKTKKQRKKERKRLASVPPVTVVQPRPSSTVYVPTRRPEPQLLIPGVDHFTEDDQALIDALIFHGWSRQDAEEEVYGTWDDLDWNEIDVSGMSPATRAFYELT